MASRYVSGPRSHSAACRWLLGGGPLGHAQGHEVHQGAREAGLVSYRHGQRRHWAAGGNEHHHVSATDQCHPRNHGAAQRPCRAMVNLTTNCHKPRRVLSVCATPLIGSKSCAGVAYPRSNLTSKSPSFPNPCDSFDPLFVSGWLIYVLRQTVERVMMRWID